MVFMPIVVPGTAWAAMAASHNSIRLATIEASLSTWTM